MKYIVTTKRGKVVKPGDKIKDFRGDTFTFLEVTRGPEYNGTAKVYVADPKGWKHEYYHHVFNLKVKPVPGSDLGGITDTFDLRSKKYWAGIGVGALATFLLLKKGQ
jgi:hypothetical protein